jgi:creatinine amidohydrolase/Fe(II)-dependent formamide hydrolase-like protein
VIPSLPDRFRLGRLTTEEIAALDGKKTLVVLPIGAVEQHGPHLPVLTDALVAEALLARALERRPDDGRVWALPTQAYGKSNEHAGFAGVFALSARTLAATLLEIAEGVAASGLRRLMFLNGHGGNTDVLDYVARDARAAHEIVCVSAHPFRFGLAAGVISDAEGGFGIHAGEAETSTLLALAPELVHPDRFAPDLPAVRSSLRRLSLKGAASFGWLTRDLSASGTIGDPRAASAEKGEAILDAEADLVVELIEEALALPLPEAR